jgi:hypothetical protein
LPNLEVDYVFPAGNTVTKVFPDFEMGKIPLMLRSRLCYLTGMDGYTVGECKFEPGGYFIIDIMARRRSLLDAGEVGQQSLLLWKEGASREPFETCGTCRKVRGD